MMLDHVTVGDGGFELYYEDVGSGPAVVFVHGFSNNHLSWWQQVPTFERDYRCILPDMRGFGLSVDAAGRGVAAFADDLVALLDELALDRVALVGHSMGGWPVGSVASQHPDRVAALVLSASPGGLIPPERHRELMAAGSTPDLDEIPLTAEKQFLAGAIEALNLDSPDDWEATRAVLDELPLDAARIVDAGIPVLVIVGEADEFMPPSAVEAVADRLDAESAIVEGAAHSVFYEQPAAFNRRVTAFLADRARF